MNGFLKGYYGYKNLGDELIFFGIVKYLFKNYKLEKLYVEVGDIYRMNLWITRNDSLLGDLINKIIIVDKKFNFGKHNINMLFIGGGEVITDQRVFPHNGRNYLIKYIRQLFLGKIVFLGGIGKPKKLFSKTMYKLLLKNANEIVVRDKQSYDIALNYNSKVVLYEDFAKNIVEQIAITKTQDKRVLVNMNPYIFNQESLNKIDQILQKFKSSDIYYVPFDIYEDKQYFDNFIQIYPHIKLYDWTLDNVDKIIQFMSNCQSGIGARLHFLLILKWLNKQHQPLFYQEKIQTFFAKNKS